MSRPLPDPRPGLDPGPAIAGAAEVALDALGAVMRPLDALHAGGAGWWAEHLQFLHEPLDALAGDPAQVRAQAQVWQGVAAQLRGAAAAHRRGVANTVWDGAAGDAYRAAAGQHVQRIEEVATRADELAGLIVDSGVAVGIVRTALRDLVVAFLWAAVLPVAAGPAGGWPGTVVADALAHAHELAAELARRIDTLTADLAALADRARRIAEELTR